MGASLSDTYSIKDFQVLKFNIEDLAKIATLFQTIDEGNYKKIRLPKLLHTIGIRQTVCLRNLFTFVDIVGDGLMDGRTFIFFVWNICTLTDLEIASFIFQQYCYKDTLILDSSVAIKLIHDINGLSGDEDSDEEEVMSYDMLDDIKSGDFSEEKFLSLIRQHPVLVAPVRAFKDALQEHTLGKMGWLPYIESRLSICSTRIEAVIGFFEIQLTAPPAVTVETKEDTTGDEPVPVPPPAPPAAAAAAAVTALSELGARMRAGRASVIGTVSALGSALSAAVSADPSTVGAGNIESNRTTPQHSARMMPTTAEMLSRLPTIDLGEAPNPMAMLRRTASQRGSAPNTPKPQPASTKASSNYYKDDHSAIVVKPDVKIVRYPQNTPSSRVAVSADAEEGIPPDVHIISFARGVGGGGNGGGGGGGGVSTALSRSDVPSSPNSQRATVNASDNAATAAAVNPTSRSSTPSANDRKRSVSTRISILPIIFKAY